MNNTKTFLFAGASSLMATETAVLLKKKGHTVIGITRKPVNTVYDRLLAIEEYAFGKFPVVDEALDGIVYFPGTITLKPFHRLSPQDFTNDYQINALGSAAFIQAYLANLKKTPTASIILISSVAAQTGLPFHASISMAKAALEGLTKALAAELAPTIRVNCVAPSLVDTPMSLKFIETSDKMEQMKKRNPMRQVGTGYQLAEAIIFLLLESSSWITGQILAVDGGMNTLKT
jgi:3-oxoacyl-[acyl-carrier protein] reductase